MPFDTDIVVIGGGIIGLSTAMMIRTRFPAYSVRLVEKETAVATHQSGHNSGVVHAGVYYAPGSLKARFCKEGAVATRAFCDLHGLPILQCGKLIVATDDSELERLTSLQVRCGKNGIDSEWLNAYELKCREPNVAGVAAILVPSSAITDYGAIARKMADLIVLSGGHLELGTAVTDIREELTGVVVETTNSTIHARYIVVCGGLMADRLARLCGIDLDFRIIPFRGEYYQLADAKSEIVNHLIYPVPDPSLPFLGIHLTRTIDGAITVGPNAVLACAKEGYRWQDVNVTDIVDMLAFRGFWRVLQRHGRSGLRELLNSVSKASYLRQCQKYCPTITVEDFLPYPAGVRAQAVLANGTLVEDFLVRTTKRTLHVCNAPSPAATSAIPIASHINDLAKEAFHLRPASVE